jgi:hypothetical protein
VLGPLPANAERPDRELARLAHWMSGSFSSAAQADRDTNFSDMRLHVVPIWPERHEARWFYVEQAAASQLDRPYRQRVYRLSRRSDGRFESAVYTLQDPMRFAGAWRDSVPLAGLTPDSLTLRDGCAVILHFDRGAFVGGIEGNGCASDLRGAARATSEVLINEGRMVTLDRGWNAAGKQVWGSTHGAYEFVKEGGPPR